MVHFSLFGENVFWRHEKNKHINSNFLRKKIFTRKLTKHSLRILRHFMNNLPTTPNPPRHRFSSSWIDLTTSHNLDIDIISKYCNHFLTCTQILYWINRNIVFIVYLHKITYIFIRVWIKWMKNAKLDEIKWM